MCQKSDRSTTTAMRLVSTREDKDGIGVAQLDLTNPAGLVSFEKLTLGRLLPLPKTGTPSSLHLSSQRQAFCPSQGARLRVYTKYSGVNERIRGQCDDSQ